MENSILNEVKKVCNTGADYGEFDSELIMDINSVIVEARQMGVPIEKGFVLHDCTETWSQMLPKEYSMSSLVKTYIAYKVKLMFDPSTSSTVTESIKNVISEAEWRLHVGSDE